MKSVIWTTVRAEIEHDEPFDNKNALLEYTQELLDYTSLPLGQSVDLVCSLVALEVVEDEVLVLNGKDDDDE